MRPKWGAISFDELAVNKFLAATFHVRLDVCYRYGGKSDCGFALCVCVYVKDLLMAFGEQHNIIAINKLQQFFYAKMSKYIFAMPESRTEILYTRGDLGEVGTGAKSLFFCNKFLTTFLFRLSTIL